MIWICFDLINLPKTFVFEATDAIGPMANQLTQLVGHLLKPFEFTKDSTLISKHRDVNWPCQQCHESAESFPESEIDLGNWLTIILFSSFNQQKILFSGKFGLEIYTNPTKLSWSLSSIRISIDFPAWSLIFGEGIEFSIAEFISAQYSILKCSRG